MKGMNRYFTRRLLAVAAAACGLTGNAYASGIPTVDVLGIAQMVTQGITRAAEAKAALDAAMNAIDQAKSQFDDMKRMVSGNSRYGSRYNNSKLTDYIPTTTAVDGWEQIYSNVDSGAISQMRNRYGLTSKNQMQQEVWDTRLADFQTSKASYSASNLRLENIKNLQAEADAAITPQEKSDIQARIATEQAAIATDSNRLASMKDLQEKQDRINKQRLNANFNKFLETGVH